MILIQVLSGSLDTKRFMALVELEDPRTCAHCGESMPAGGRAVFLAEPRGARLAHLRSECPRPAREVRSRHE